MLKVGLKLWVLIKKKGIIHIYYVYFSGEMNLG